MSDFIEMEKALENWDGNWLWRFTGRDNQTGKFKEFGWFNTEKEAKKALADLTDGIIKNHTNCKIKITSKGSKAFIFVHKPMNTDMYVLSVDERRSCFMNK